MSPYRPSDSDLHDVISRLELASVSEETVPARDRLLADARRALSWDPSIESQRRARHGVYDAAVRFKYDEDL